MRSRKNPTISNRQVHEWTSNRLVQAKLVKDHGPLCTAAVVLNVVLRAAARLISLCAACDDLANGPCGQSVLNALHDGLPKTLSVLERRLNAALTGDLLPPRMKRRKWEIAIDWHLVPYYGQPLASRNELYYGKPKAGTKYFHAYATACITYHGSRYTLALTWVRRHESTVVALRRLLARIRELDVKIRYLLLDRAFFNVPVAEFLQAENLPFLMPVMFRGRAPKNKRARRTGLHWIKQQKAGWYSHTLRNKRRTVNVRVCVAYRTSRHRRTGKRRQDKLLFAAWRVGGTPKEIKTRYRLRFGIESSYRQLRQARIYTCTRCPRLRLAFIAIALILRNMWVWIHDTILAEKRGPKRTINLAKLRFKRLLEWIAQTVVDVIRSPSTGCSVLTT